MKPVLEGSAPLLQVFDMPASIRFYRDLLGFEVAATSPPLGGVDDFNWVMLRNGEITLMLNTAYEPGERPPAPPPERTRAHEDTGLYFGCRDLDAAYEHFRAEGVALQPPAVAPYGMRQLWLHDPDGYLLCLQWPVEQGS